MGAVSLAWKLRRADRVSDAKTARPAASIRLRSRIALLAYDGALAVSNILLNLLVRLLFWRNPKIPGNRTMVLRAGTIGDILVAVPALRLLREQSRASRITLLNWTKDDAGSQTSSNTACKLVTHRELCDEVITFNAADLWNRRRRQRLKSLIRASRPDRVLLLPFSGETLWSLCKKALLFRLLGIEVRPEGFRIVSIPSLFTRSQLAARRIVHQAIAAAIPVAGPHATVDESSFRLPQNLRAAASLAKTLERAGVPEGCAVLMVGVSAKYAHKRWPVACFASVILKIRDEFCVFPVIVGGAEDFELGRQLQEMLGGAAANLCGCLNLDESVELARMAVAFLGNDSGAAHLAAAGGARTFTIFSAIHPPGLWEPAGGQGKTYRARVKCEYCRSETRCVNGSLACVMGVDPRPVIADLRNLLAICVKPSASANYKADKLAASLGRPTA